jgi:hypothetical protein
MNAVSKKIASISALPYKVIVYCPRCTTRRFIRLNDYPGYTLEDIHLRMTCTGCGAVGLDFSIVQDDNPEPVHPRKHW